MPPRWNNRRRGNGNGRNNQNNNYNNNGSNNGHQNRNQNGNRQNQNGGQQYQNQNRNQQSQNAGDRNQNQNQRNNNNGNGNYRNQNYNQYDNRSNNGNNRNNQRYQSPPAPFTTDFDIADAPPPQIPDVPPVFEPRDLDGDILMDDGYFFNPESGRYGVARIAAFSFDLLRQMHGNEMANNWLQFGLYANRFEGQDGFSWKAALNDFGLMGNNFGQGAAGSDGSASPDVVL